MLGVSRRVQRIYGMIVHLAILLSNHYQFLLAPTDARQGRRMCPSLACRTQEVKQPARHRVPAERPKKPCFANLGAAQHREFIGGLIEKLVAEAAANREAKGSMVLGTAGVRSVGWHRVSAWCGVGQGHHEGESCGRGGKRLA